MPIHDKTFRSHEEFSLTGMLFKQTQKINNSGILGPFAARVINLTCSPFTALIDATAHLALGALSIAPLSEFGWLCNIGIWVVEKCTGEKDLTRFPITFTGGMINLFYGIVHTIGIVAAPILGALDPDAAAMVFVHKRTQKQAAREQKALAEKETALTEKLGNEISVLEVKLTNKEKELENLTKKLNTQSDHITENNHSLKNHALQISKLKDEIKALKSNLKVLKSNLPDQLKKLNNQLKTARDNLIHKYKKIKKVNGEKDQLKNKLEKLNNRLKEKDENIKTTNELNTKLENEIKSLQSELNTRSIEIDDEFQSCEEPENAEECEEELVFTNAATEYFSKEQKK